MSFENGLFINFDYKLTEIYRKLIRSEIKIYENLDDYIGDYTTESDVQLANFRKIFQYFFYLCVLIIVAFVLNNIYRYRKVIKKCLKKSIRKLTRYYFVYIVIMLSKTTKYLNNLDSRD